MAHSQDEDATPGFASPPCFMHETDPAWCVLADATDPRQRTDVMRWRKAERESQIAARLAIPADRRRDHAIRIMNILEGAIGDVQGLTVGFYWPFRGEPDPRHLLRRIDANGGRIALPVVVRRREAMLFRAWRPGEALEHGIWNIPVPTAAAPTVQPDVIVAPVVAFDRRCFRLGYGGGYYDRTLAGLGYRPRVFGVGYASARIATIYPQPHDLAMDAVVTEQGIAWPVAAAPMDAR
ncbi:MAG: 5-formyltetrahydrofolate cyclo-ligase [Alphaproteobacteria bacterium]|nr:5-formyltetrahydrofolate cyclo-ligase [Alphaproteobacteria bacterium]